jgi:hypothetical protein
MQVDPGVGSMLSKGLPCLRQRPSRKIPTRWLLSTEPMCLVAGVGDPAHGSQGHLPEDTWATKEEVARRLKTCPGQTRAQSTMWDGICSPVWVGSICHGGRVLWEAGMLEPVYSVA